MTDQQWTELEARLARSAFRSRFHLTEKDKDYVRNKGLDTIEDHAREFIAKRLAPAEIANDGRQTPMRGHPVFIAQHATGCCCRWGGSPRPRSAGWRRSSACPAL